MAEFLKLLIKIGAAGGIGGLLWNICRILWYVLQGQVPPGSWFKFF